MSAEASRPRLHGLYAITPDGLEIEALLARTAQAISGGAALVQFRDKAGSFETRRARAERLATLCRSHGVAYIVNDEPELARIVEADGVHLGRDDGDVRAARRLLPRAVIGVSCYADTERARIAAGEGADYVAIGSVFTSATKPGARRAPLELIEQAKRASSLPVCAIGGITPDNAARAIAAGADMLAVIAALYDTPDPRAAAHAIARLFPANRHHDDDVRTQPRAL